MNIFFLLVVVYRRKKLNAGMVPVAGWCVDRISFKYVSVLVMCCMWWMMGALCGTIVFSIEPHYGISFQIVFAHLCGSRLNFDHINPGSAVSHIGVLNTILDGTDLQVIARSKIWFNAKHANRQIGRIEVEESMVATLPCTWQNIWGPVSSHLINLTLFTILMT
jgi:hypothetical protein